MSQLKDIKLLRKTSIVIKALREAKGVTQQDVYHDINIHVGRIESANANLTVSTLSVLCEYFNITMSDFFKEVENTR